MRQDSKSKYKEKINYLIDQQILSTIKISPNTDEFQTIRILEIELEEPLPPISAVDHATGRMYHYALCLIRFHTKPLGMIALTLDGSKLCPSQYVHSIWQTLHVAINEHLLQDGLQLLTEMPVTGILAPGIPRCVEQRNQFATNAPFVSIIVPTRDRSESLAVCLRSLATLCYPHYEVIVIDNSPSTDAAARLVQQNEYQVPHLRYIRENRPGLSLARNCGAAAAKGEIIAYTDDDVIVDSYWLIELVRAFSLADNVACVTGNVIPRELETPSQLWFERYTGFGRGFTRAVFSRENDFRHMPLYPYVAGSLGAGANMAFTRSFLTSVKGFDPALGPGRQMTGEDMTIFFQVITQNYVLVYEPASLVYHLHRRSYESLLKQICEYGAGFSAFLTKCFLDNPALLLDFALKAPYILRLLLSTKQSRQNEYPKGLINIERRGRLLGPLIYLRNRWETRALQSVFDEHPSTIQAPQEDL